MDEVRRGGFGVVYVVRAADTSRMVLKTLDARLLWSRDDYARFEREALTWMRLDPYRHISPALGVERIEGLPCVITPYAEGGDLASLLRAGPLPPDRALRFARHLCDGLHQAHRQLGLVHRDVKPANCLLTEDNTLRVTDFGLARAFGSVAVDGASPGFAAVALDAASPGTTVAGTPAYMAPEQFEQGAVLDTRADIYAFGLVVWEMVTGVPLPRADKGRRAARRVVPRHLRRTGLFRLVFECTEPDRAQRPSDFSDVRELLDEAYLDTVGRRAPPPPGPARRNAEEWVSHAWGLYYLEQFNEVLAAVRCGLKTADQDRAGAVTESKLWGLRGSALHGQHRWEESLRSHDRSVELNPHEPSAWQNRAWALHRMKRPDEAIASYDRCLELNPDSVKAWENKASLLTDLGRYAEAEESFARALTLEPRNEWAWMNRARLRQKTSRYADALGDVDQALSISPRFLEGLSVKGDILVAMSRTNEAWRLYSLMHEIDPGHPAPWWGKMLIESDLGHYSSAAKCCEKFLEVGGEDALALVYLGAFIRAAQGDGEHVRKCFDRAIELDPVSAPGWVEYADTVLQPRDPS